MDIIGLSVSFSSLVEWLKSDLRNGAFCGLSEGTKNRTTQDKANCTSMCTEVVKSGKGKFSRLLSNIHLLYCCVLFGQLPHGKIVGGVVMLMGKRGHQRERERDVSVVTNQHTPHRDTDTHTHPRETHQ